MPELKVSGEDICGMPKAERQNSCGRRDTLEGKADGLGTVTPLQILLGEVKFC